MEPSIAPAMDRRPSTPFSTESSCIRDSPDQEFRLRWNNYQANLAQVFDQLLQTESFVDVTLTTDEGQSLKCHKVVLSACSPYFQQLFMENPCQHPIGKGASINYVGRRVGFGSYPHTPRGPMGSPSPSPMGVGNWLWKTPGVGDFNWNPMGFWWGFYMVFCSFQTEKLAFLIIFEKKLSYFVIFFSKILRSTPISLY